ncbi:MAG TPA: nucleoside deaminase [Acidobacteriaceae bacterium]
MQIDDQQPLQPEQPSISLQTEVHGQKEAWMRRAIDLATANVASGSGGPFGAVIVRGEAVLAEGANQVVATHDPTAHAEIVAMRRAAAALGSFELRGCQIYSSCEPCPMCLAAIHWARLDCIYYGSTAEDAAAAGFDDARLYGQFQLDRDLRSIPSVPLLRQEAGASFAAWSASPLRVEY